ncbi:hypothetical protein BDZ97DRAFT_600063 [Flammula alnicola]|nr:hypothetical protein BDZ97DRAFT_600063 [Flammula alnicola]
MTTLSTFRKRYRTTAQLRRYWVLCGHTPPFFEPRSTSWSWPEQLAVELMPSSLPSPVSLWPLSAQSQWSVSQFCTCFFYAADRAGQVVALDAAVDATEEWARHTKVPEFLSLHSQSPLNRALLYTHAQDHYNFRLFTRFHDTISIYHNINVAISLSIFVST